MKPEELELEGQYNLEDLEYDGPDTPPTHREPLTPEAEEALLDAIFGVESRSTPKPVEFGPLSPEIARLIGELPPA